MNVHLISVTATDLPPEADGRRAWHGRALIDFRLGPIAFHRAWLAQYPDGTWDIRLPRASATAYATMRAGGEKDELIARARHVLDSLASVEDTANAA